MLIILVHRKPLFPGQYEVDQLGKIFEVSFTSPLNGWCCWGITGWPICFALWISKSKNQVIGTPLEADWPEESSVLRSNFSYARGRGVHGILAELDPQVGCHVITLDLTNARSHKMRAMCQKSKKKVTSPKVDYFLPPSGNGPSKQDADVPPQLQDHRCRSARPPLLCRLWCQPPRSLKFKFLGQHHDVHHVWLFLESQLFRGFQQQRHGQVNLICNLQRWIICRCPIYCF